MKIEKLRKEAVRATREVEDAVHLSDQELKRIVSGDGGPAGDVDPDTCAIHFYYPIDAVG